MDPTPNELRSFLCRTERELARLRRRERVWRVGALAGLAWIALAPAWVDAGRARTEVVVASRDGGQEAVLRPGELVFRLGGDDRLRLQADEHWSGITGYGDDGHVAWTLGEEDGLAALKFFSEDRELRVEVAESLLDLGSGVRVYDPHGQPRATLYTTERRSGLRLTDPTLQPLVDVRADADGSSVIRAVDASASNVAELAVLPLGDIISRVTGGVPETLDGAPFGPMLYLQDRAERTVVNTPTPTF